jgi:hypothetical protein
MFALLLAVEDEDDDDGDDNFLLNLIVRRFLMPFRLEE